MKRLLVVTVLLLTACGFSSIDPPDVTTEELAKEVEKAPFVTLALGELGGHVAEDVVVLYQPEEGDLAGYEFLLLALDEEAEKIINSEGEPEYAASAYVGFRIVESMEIKEKETHVRTFRGQARVLFVYRYDSEKLQFVREDTW